MHSLYKRQHPKQPFHLSSDQHFTHVVSWYDHGLIRGTRWGRGAGGLSIPLPTDHLVSANETHRRQNERKYSSRSVEVHRKHDRQVSTQACIRPTLVFCCVAIPSLIHAKHVLCHWVTSSTLTDTYRDEDRKGNRKENESQNQKQAFLEEIGPV